MEHCTAGFIGTALPPTATGVLSFKLLHHPTSTFVRGSEYENYCPLGSDLA